MSISTALATDLAALTEAADTDTSGDLDLEKLLQAFTADVRSAVNSYLGMSLTTVVNGCEVSFATGNTSTSDAATAASILIPLTALTDGSQGGQLLLYATLPGAFVDLAADLNYDLGLDNMVLVLDQHRTWRADDSGMAGLDAHSTTNRAIGVLIGNGHTTESAHTELHRLANTDSGDLQYAARVILEIPRP